MSEEKTEIGENSIYKCKIVINLAKKYGMWTSVFESNHNEHD